MNIRVTDDKVIIDGYVNAVERLSKPLKDRLGTFVERVKAGAFKRALERADDVRILINHDWQRDIGGIKDGNLELSEDAIGLRAHAEITDPKTVADVKSGKTQFRGWSFGFTDREVEQGEENGLTVRNVKDLNLYEVSLIDRSRVPAYDGTLVAVRSADDSERVNIADVTESEIKLRVEEEQPANNDNHAADNGAVDYTEYHKIIEEMKGDN
jgi:HK97 family phage prohead protease